MGKVYFLFGVHNHQPVGNFHHIFEGAYQRCYFPFLSLLEKFPGIKCSLHTSGCLYDWLSENKGEYIQMLKKLVKEGQVEIISGGYYEPILPLISDEDKKGQIRLMNDVIKGEFETKPQGIWVAERVWEPYLAKIINSCDLKYTFLDDTHFRYAGYREKEFFGYYTTEEEGRQIFVFPISKTLRYKIPFSQPQEAIDILNGFAQEGDRLVSLFDDGEKFGFWPHTYEWVYEKEWLKKFLSLLEKSSHIETITPSQAVEKFSSKGIIYLPTASYEEMGEWVLEPKTYFLYENLKLLLKEHSKFEEFKDFVRGGFFRNFYRKYSRLNYMHKKMLTLSRKINHQTNFEKDKNIFMNLWKAQTNCGYWHGIFGGFYLGHIRSSIYEHLIYAENAWDKKYTEKELVLEEEDIDLDGHREIVLKNKHILCCFSRKGATLLELSLREPAINLLNTITRREESYHQKIREDIKKQSAVATIHDMVSPKEEGLEKFLIYDTYERLALVDLLLDKNLTVDNFNFQRGVSTLSDEVYLVSTSKSKKGFSLECHYHDEELDFLKRVDFSSLSGFDLLYKFRKKNLLTFYNFGIEFNLSFPSLNEIFKEDEEGDTPLYNPKRWKDIRSFSIIDYYKRIRVEFESSPADVFTLPLYSVSSSESGFERVYQQITLLFIVRGRKNTFKLTLRVNPVKKFKRDVR